MERFIRLNRSILDCDLAKGGWRLDEEGIAAIEDEVAGLRERLPPRAPPRRYDRSAVPYREGPTEMRLAAGAVRG